LPANDVRHIYLGGLVAYRRPSKSIGASRSWEFLCSVPVAFRQVG
jgi:hypothetical protein